jgi:LmbE family N-acetylglucosaminyl deacetylase
MEEWEFKHHPDAFCNVPVDVGAARLLELFETYRPDVVITYSDAGGYNHPDHLQAHRITVAAVGRSDIPSKLYLIARRRRDWQAMRARLEALGLEFPQLPEPSPERLAAMAKLEALITTNVDVRSVVDRKRAAAMAHASQLDEPWFSRIPPDVWARCSARSRSSARDTSARPFPRTTSSPACADDAALRMNEFFVPPLVADSARQREPGRSGVAARPPGARLGCGALAVGSRAAVRARRSDVVRGTRAEPTAARPC